MHATFPNSSGGTIRAQAASHEDRKYFLLANPDPSGDDSDSFVIFFCHFPSALGPSRCPRRPRGDGSCLSCPANPVTHARAEKCLCHFFCHGFDGSLLTESPWTEEGRRQSLGGMAFLRG